MRGRREIETSWVRGLLALTCALACLAALAPAAPALNVPPGFQATRLLIPRAEEGSADYITGLQYPTAIDFAPNGEMFVAERNGRVKVFESVEDTSPTLVADINPDVMGRGDRGLLGMKLDPEYPSQPYMYLAYTHDAPIGGQAPTQSDDPSGADYCDESPPYTGCIASGRIVRLQLNPATDVPVGGVDDPEQHILVESWCQQFLSHSIGDIEFDSSGALLAGGGDGASWEVADHGQFANANACDDPEHEGGSLRAQDLRTPATASDPTEYSGTIIRIDRFTGEPMPENPLIGSSDVAARRILAYGLRNPFRFEFRPGTDELYVADVGWYTWEELDRIASPPLPEQTALNFGWPCYEGFGPEPDWQALASSEEAPLCESLYGMPAGTVTYPIFEYAHGLEGQVFAGDTCEPTYGASMTGLAFYEPEGVQADHAFPSSYDGTLFFADSSRGCIWAMHAGPDGSPDPEDITNFVTPEGEGGQPFTPVDITQGPDGALYVPNFFDSSIERIRYFAAGPPPVAKLAADRTFGAVPLQTHLDASGSSDPEGETLHYSWDLDGDGSFGEGPDAPTVDKTFSESKTVSVGVRVTDEDGNSEDARLTIYPGDLGPPEPEIEATGENWTIGDTISFAGTAPDPDAEEVRLDWEVTIRHCPNVTTCHTHPLTSFTNVASGQLVAPPHEYPSHLVLALTAHDKRGLSRTVSRDLYPRTVNVSLSSEPPGVPLTFDAETAPAPLAGLMIAGGNANVSAPLSAELGGTAYEFRGWSDGGPRSHTISATESTQLVASYRRVGGGPPEEGPPETHTAVNDPPLAGPFAIQLLSRPAGVRLRVDGSRRRTPFGLEILADERLLATAPRRATVHGRRLRFRRWADGAPRSRWVTAGEVAMLCAIYSVEEPRRRAR